MVKEVFMDKKDFEDGIVDDSDLFRLLVSVGRELDKELDKL